MRLIEVTNLRTDLGQVPSCSAVRAAALMLEGYIDWCALSLYDQVRGPAVYISPESFLGKDIFHNTC
jgi:hypothetical protein